MQEIAQELAAALNSLGDGSLLVVTGAGISQASGIATFRGSEPGAVWKTHDIALATHEYFRRDPVGQWLWYLQRFDSVRQAQPNAAHHALVEIASWLEARDAQLHLVTQNIDTLHERAGTRDLIKVHGTSDRIRCSRPGCIHGAPSGSLAIEEADFSTFVEDPDRSNLPCCPECGSLLRAHVLLFDEYYLEHQDYRFVEAENLATQAAAILFVGTSFSVGVTDMYLRTGGQRGIPMYSVDPSANAESWPGLRTLAAPAEELLPAVCAMLD